MSLTARGSQAEGRRGRHLVEESSSAGLLHCMSGLRALGGKSDARFVEAFEGAKMAILSPLEVARGAYAMDGGMSRVEQDVAELRENLDAANELRDKEAGNVSQLEKATEEE